jgi:hypothetical protein
MEIEMSCFESPDLMPLDFCLWDWMKSEVYKRTVDKRDELLARILDTAARIKNVKINSDEGHAIFAHELHSALRLTVGFSNIYCNL